MDAENLLNSNNQQLIVAASGSIVTCSAEGPILLPPTFHSGRFSVPSGLLLVGFVVSLGAQNCPETLSKKPRTHER